jgi:tetratricopeptide (TPR) repeat protein
LKRRFERSFLMRELRITVLIAAVLVLLAAEQALAQVDTIVINIGGKRQKFERVLIGKEGWDRVGYKVSTGPGSRYQYETTENVLDVIHGNQPSRFGTAEQHRKDGNWKNAIQDYQNCIKHERKEWVKIYSQFHLAQCYHMWSKTDASQREEAIKQYEVFNSKYTDHRFRPQALYGLGMVAEAAGNTGKAKSAYDDLGGGKYGENWEIRGQFYSIMLTGGSARKIEGLIRRAKQLKMNDIVAAGRLGLAQTLLKGRKYREAKKAYEEIVKNPEGVGKEVLAAAHNGLGDCYKQLASREDDKKKALFEYLKVVTLYASAHKQYIYALQKAIDLLGEIGGDVYKNRIADLRKELTEANKR